jgi:hypothetical protein
MNRISTPGGALRVAAVLAVIATGAFFAAGCEGGGGKSEPSDATYQAYFATLSPPFAALDAQIPTLDLSGNAQGPAFAATLSTYDGALKTFAAALEKLDAPGMAAPPHGNLISQSKAIATTFDGIASKLSSPSYTPTSDELTLSLTTSGSVIQWVAACQRLQDIAQTKGVTLDFKCGTTLGLGSTSNSGG